MVMIRGLRMSSYCFFLLLLQHITAGVSALSRLDFPSDFVFGAGVSAYQHEGAAAEDGRKPSIWDTYVHQGKTFDRGTGDIAADLYHKYKEDVKLMHEMGLEAFRFSISWSRLIPDGYGAVNPKGLNYYNSLINELVSYGIEPHVTLSHFDYPQALQDEYKGFQSRKFIEDFTAYADVCFKEFGDRVKTWITFNEPNIIGYGFTGGCAGPFSVNCSMDVPVPEPYEASHNVILSHVAAVQLYRTKYQEKQKGQIGITLLTFWYEPVTNSYLDIAATDQRISFSIDWFMEPLVYGRYPAIMRRLLGSVLPHFTEKETNLVKGSFDFVGLNHYMVIKVDQHTATVSGYEDGSIPKLLGYIKEKYENPTVVIHENGYSTDDDASSPASFNDTKRIECLHKNIQSMLPAIRNGTNLKAYFVWSFLDGLEVYGGYAKHFGLYGVDFNDRNRTRYPRLSSYWYTSFLAKHRKETETSSLLFAE